MPSRFGEFRLVRVFDRCSRFTQAKVISTMSGRHYQPFVNNSLAIRQEIQRFESVHPSIYAIYDLIDLISDAPVAQQIRDHVVCIEGEFQVHYTHFLLQLFV